MRLTKIYTRKGDNGTTSVGPGDRISKDSARIEVLGTLDELNSTLGLVLAFQPTHTDIRNTLTRIQHDLFDIGGELCPPHHIVITAERVTHLETLLDQWNETLPPLEEFILPGGNPKSATCHVARTICRRAERRLVTLHQETPVNAEILRYLNRLSDLLFVIARMLARENHSEEIFWEHN